MRAGGSGPWGSTVRVAPPAHRCQSGPKASEGEGVWVGAGGLHLLAALRSASFWL